jgi:hypothetical protein
MAINTGFEGQSPLDHGKRMVDEARAFRQSMGAQAESLSKAIDLAGRIQRHPLTMVAAAAGLGYVLGGGLFSPLTGRLLRIGVKVALIPLIRGPLKELTNLAEQATEGSAGRTS